MSILCPAYRPYNWEHLATSVSPWILNPVKKIKKLKAIKVTQCSVKIEALLKKSSNFKKVLR